MARAELAYLILGLFAFTALAMAVQSARYRRYREEKLRGKQNLTTVRRPFWLG